MCHCSQRFASRPLFCSLMYHSVGSIPSISGIDNDDAGGGDADPDGDDGGGGVDELLVVCLELLLTMTLKNQSWN